MANPGDTPFAGVASAFTSFITGLQNMSQKLESIDSRLKNIENHINNGDGTMISSPPIMQTPTNMNQTTTSTVISSNSPPSFSHRDRIVSNASIPKATNFPHIPKSVDPKSIIMPNST